DFARGQLASEDSLARHANRLLFCDTCATTTALWHELLFGAPHPQIQTLEAHRRYALTLVCDPDAPFVDDTHRISEHTRQPFSELLLQHLSTTPEPVVHLRGDWDARFEAALAALSRQFPWAQTR
ncbi:MAG: AAA family ATPase, partial [Myxococcales bacterium]|nr:AAA family ATPase [Myxococcales bacterium]